MKSRLLVAAVGIPLLLIVLFVCPPVVAAVAIAALCAIGARELLFTTGISKHKGIVILAMAMAALVPLWSYFGCITLVGAAVAFVFMALVFAQAMVAFPAVPFSSVSGALFAGIVIPLCLSSVSRILTGDHGKLYVLLPVMIPFVSDAGAYFVGCSMGKHKMAPALSPKKTVEGAVGGILSGILAMVIYGLVMKFAFAMEVNFIYCGIYGVFGAVIAIIGDLSFSMIKRETGIKDYGTLFRAHGGVLDRFDSVIFAAPLVELLIRTLPILN